MLGWPYPITTSWSSLRSSLVLGRLRRVSTPRQNRDPLSHAVLNPSYRPLYTGDSHPLGPSATAPAALRRPRVPPPCALHSWHGVYQLVMSISKLSSHLIEITGFIISAGPSKFQPPASTLVSCFRLTSVSNLSVLGPARLLPRMPTPHARCPVTPVLDVHSDALLFNFF